MLNFVQLALQAKDPAYQAQRRQRDLEEEQKLLKHEALCGAAIDLLVEKSQVDQYALTEKEGAFIRSAKYHFRSSRYLSEPQAKWLFDLASRHGHIFDSVPGAFAFRHEGRIIAVCGHGAADVKSLSSNDEFSDWAKEIGITHEEGRSALAVIHVSAPPSLPRQVSDLIGPALEQIKPIQDTSFPQPRKSLAEKLAARNNPLKGPDPLSQPVRNRHKG